MTSPTPDQTISGVNIGAGRRYIVRHLRFGWWSLLVFLTLGLLLELFHGFKAGFYLDVSNETRRLMWTLAHAHGTLLALVHIALAASLNFFSPGAHRSWGLISACLMGASILMPVGFFLGGLYTYAGDPGLGILLVPLGALLLFMAVFSMARSVTLGLNQGEASGRGKKGKKRR